ncbi:MAG: winged helix-turn-helix domain-containing protein [Halobacteriota archaeon]
MKSRSEWSIILDILRIIYEEEKEGKVKKTRIMHKANLDWKNFQKRFNFLLDKELIESISDLEKGESYYLTEKGIDLMRRLREVEKILK